MAMLAAASARARGNRCATCLATGPLRTGSGAASPAAEGLRVAEVLEVLIDLRPDDCVFANCTRPIDSEKNSSDAARGSPRRIRVSPRELR